MADDEQRLIIATCEKGTVEDVADMNHIKKGLDDLKERFPNLVDVSATKAIGRRRRARSHRSTPVEN